MARLLAARTFIVFFEAGRVLGLVVDERLVRSLTGRSLEDVVEAAFKSSDRVVVEKFLAVRESLVGENWRRVIKLFSDVAPALRAFKSTGFLLAVTSSSRVECAVEFLEHFKILGFSALLKALSQVCLVNQMAVYVGDRGVDCVASSRAGVDFIMVNRRGESSPSDLNCRPQAVVENLLELPSALSKL